MYVGVYRDFTGWGRAALDYILALDAAGVDVVCRPLKLNDRRAPLPPRILELEAKSSRGCDVVVQHVLPHQMDYSGRFAKNVGLFASETSDFRASAWAESLDCMDEVWVINRQQVGACHRSGVSRPVRVLPHATDVSRFERGYEPLEQLKPHRDRGEFLFYFVGEFVRRKNLGALLRAFHAEFDPDEPVRLVLKTDLPGMSRGELEKHVRAFCAEVRRGLKLNGGRHAEEILVLDRLTDEGVMRLHAGCDCAVSASYGEAWGIPQFDAMAMGKTPIVPAWGGFADYMTPDTGWLVDWHEEPVFGVTDSFSDLYTGRETWAGVSIPHLRRCMREAYENGGLRKDKAANGIQRAYDFSYHAVGETARRLLENDILRAAGTHVATAAGPGR